MQNSKQHVPTELSRTLIKNHEVDTMRIPIEQISSPDGKLELSTGLARVRRAKPVPDTPELKEGGEILRTR